MNDKSVSFFSNFFYIFRVVPLLLFCVSLNVYPQGQEADENSVKAAFIYNFLKYTSWPTNKSGSQPIRIIILNQSDLYSSLHKLIQDKSLDGHPIEVFHEIQNLKDIDVIYFESEKTMDRRTLNEIKSNPILTISQAGNTKAMIRFYQENQKIRFEVDLEAVNSANIKLSSQLLKLAKVAQ